MSQVDEGDTRQVPVVLAEGRRPPVLWLIAAWALPLTALTLVTDPLGRSFGGVAVAVVWTLALMLLVGVASIARRRIRRRPRVLLFNGQELVVLDRAGRELVRAKAHHLQVEQGCHHLGDTVRGAQGWQPAVALTIAGLGTLVIGGYGLAHPGGGVGWGPPRFLVGPQQWRALVQRLGLDAAEPAPA